MIEAYNGPRGTAHKAPSNQRIGTYLSVDKYYSYSHKMNGRRFFLMHSVVDKLTANLVYFGYRSP